MKKIVYLCCAMAVMPAYGFWPFFKYDRAIAAAQKGDLVQAQNMLRQEIVHYPDDARMLYDAGVIAAQQKEYAQASAYFHQAAQQKAVPDALKVQSLFNAGNMAVELNDLQQAIDLYEQALRIDERNEQVKHNLEIVKKMLEQQQQEQQQNQQQEKQDDKQQENQNQENKNKEDKKQNGGDQKQQDKQPGSDQQDESEQDQSGSDQSGEKDEGDEQSSSEDQQQKSDTSQQQKEKPASSESKQEKLEPKEQQGQQSAGKESGEKSEQKKEGQGSGSDKKDGQGSQESQAGAAGQQGLELEKPLDIDQELLDILQAQEKQDAALNKQLMKLRVQGSEIEQSGKHNW